MIDSDLGSNHFCKPNSALSLVGLGSTKEDSIDLGIHLRWMFHPDLGFPPEGFFLYRRENDLKNRAFYNFSQVQKKQGSFPWVVQPTDTLKVGFKLISSGAKTSLGRYRIAPSKVDKLLATQGSLKIEFSHPIALAEINGILKLREKLQVKALFQKEIVYEREIEGKSTEGFHLNCHANCFDELLLTGPSIRLSDICYWWCDEKSLNDWELLNGECGFALPYSPFLDPKLINRIGDRNQADQFAVNCRLKGETVTKFSSQDLLELKQLISEMRGEGELFPVGWKVLSEEANRNNQEEVPNLFVAPYDFLMMQAQYPDIAKILGLYWLDATANPHRYYDYKVEAYWSDKTLGRLENQVTFEEELKRYFFTFTGALYSQQNLLISGPEASVTYQPPSSWQVTKGIYFKESSETKKIVLSFPKPVYEVQIFLTHSSSSVKAQAISSDHIIDEKTFSEKEKIVQLRGENIQFVYLMGAKISLYRVHYHFSPLPYGKHSYQICAMKMHTAPPLRPPTEVKGHCLKSILEQKEGKKVKKLRAGLCWTLMHNTSEKALHHTSISYDVYRKSTTSDWEKRTKEPYNPILPIDLEEKSPLLPIEIGKKEGPFQYIDEAIEAGTYFYAVEAIDIFGRRSKKSIAAPVSLKHPLPPPPGEIAAKFLDYSHNNPNDLTLDAKDRLLLEQNQESGIVVRWQWTAERKELAPNAHSFQVLFHPGWLNLLRGVPIHVRVVEDIELEVIADRDMELDALQQEWLRQGKRLFLIVSNTRAVLGEPFTIKIKKSPKALGFPFLSRFEQQQGMPVAGRLDRDPYIPREGEEFIISLTKERVYQDYSLPENWPQENRTEIEIRYPQEDLIGSQAALLATEEGTVTFKLQEMDRDSLGKITPFHDRFFLNREGYGIGYKITAVNLDSQTISIQGASEETNLFANLAGWRIVLWHDYEVFIKTENFFPNRETLKNEKVEYGQIGIGSVSSEGVGSVSLPAAVMALYQNPPEKILFMDQEPLVASKANIYGKSTFELTWPQSPELEYDIYRSSSQTLFLEDRKLFNSGYRDQAFYEQILGITQEEVATLLSRSPNYHLLSNAVLQGLATLTESAFTKLNEKPFSSRNNTPYLDKTLEGRGNNCYFYRVLAIDQVGNRSQLGMSTPPVKVPQDTPRIAPVFTKIISGDRSLSLHWNQNLDSSIQEYRIYRSDQQDRAEDVRSMDQIAVVGGSESSWIDYSVFANKNYYYRLMKIDLFGNPSLPSRLITGKAYRIGAVPAPILVSLTKMLRGDQEGVQLNWTSLESLEILVEKRLEGTSYWLALGDWLPVGLQTFEDLAVSVTGKTYYRLQGRTLSGEKSGVSNVLST